MACKYCNCEEMTYERKGPHLRENCAACGRYQRFVPQSDNPKPREAYRDEYLDRQPATVRQLQYIHALSHKPAPENISKLQASKIIEAMKTK